MNKIARNAEAYIAEKRYLYLHRKQVDHQLYPAVFHLAVVAEGSPEQDNVIGRVPGESMNVPSESTRQEMRTRLRRLEGQLRGIQNMLDQNRDCRDVVQQLASVKAAVHSANLFFIREYISSCMENSDANNPAANRQMMDELVHLLSKVT